MGFRQFTPGEYERLRNQHNIMALVGNGFDIQVTQGFEAKFSPRYTAFYHYLQSRDFDSNNLVVQQMDRLKEAGRENWSDVEAAIEALVSPPGTEDPEDVYAATVALQGAFAEYLELVAPPDLLVKLGTASSNGGLAITSVADFAADLHDVKGFKFPDETYHYDLFNFFFVNFNYTPLLDDYVFLDPAQWQPQGHTWADRNFTFRPNPTNSPHRSWNSETRFSTYLRSEVIHPHGHQAVPRSLLFGIDAPDSYNPGTHPRAKLMKHYWARNDVEYKHLFNDVRLFIVFGSSLGLTDGWWWRRIQDGLKANANSELIIYWWHDGEGDCPDNMLVLDQFARGAGLGSHDDLPQGLVDRVHVVPHSPQTSLTWLSI
mgnify:CR=1 FL=1